MRVFSKFWFFGSKNALYAAQNGQNGNFKPHIMPFSSEKSKFWELPHRIFSSSYKDAT